MMFKPSSRSGRHPFLFSQSGLMLTAIGLLCADAKAEQNDPAPQDSSAKTHWAFQPVLPRPSPRVRDPKWLQTSVDAFILAKLEQHQIQPAPPAGKRTLIRRATYDLTGLPPTPEEVESFQQDSSPGAFGKVVERLLNSSHYGEQWGRHWLDVVRYADTAGENTDHPLPHAWRYRNWVIKAFNDDKPYDEFVREQVAGDLLAQAGPPEKFAERIVATGYLAIARRFGHEIEKDMHLTFEDTIDTLGKSFLGLTLGCARCHNHKYDPLTTSDYYGLYGIFESTRFAFPGCEAKQQPRDLPPLLSASEIAIKRKPYEQELATLDAAIRQLTEEQAATVARLKALTEKSSRVLARGQFDDGGSQSFVTNSSSPLEVNVKTGEVLQLSIDPRANHGADSTLVELEIAEAEGISRRWNLTEDVVDDLLAGNPHPDRLGHAATWCFLDVRKGWKLLPESIRDHQGKKGLNVWRNGDTPSAWVNATDKPIKVWTTLPPRSFFVHPAPDGSVAVAWLSPITGAVRIKGRVADAHPGGGDGIAWTLEHISLDMNEGIAELASFATRLREPAKRRTELVAREPRIEVAYAVADAPAKNARIQKRGDPANLGPEVPRKFPDLLGGQQVMATNSSGRLELAEWLTSPANPLTARVMVNRIWQWHFGSGVVKTPNDFCTRGQPPTHPELLDHLAGEFVKSGWSVKALHRLIMLSSTYQQAGQYSLSSPTATEHWTLNTDNFSPFPRRRLSVEELRDTLLAVSGDLDLTPGAAHPFPPEENWSFTQHGPFAAEFDTTKRSVYVMQKRNRRTPLFALFDGADPNASTAIRDVTTVPTQALYFMNDPFLHARASKFAARILAAAADNDARLDLACRRLFGRPSSIAEKEEASAFLRDYAALCEDQPPEERLASAWVAYARVLFSANEFIYVD